METETKTQESNSLGLLLLLNANVRQFSVCHMSLVLTISSPTLLSLSPSFEPVRPEFPTLSVLICVHSPSLP